MFKILRPTFVIFVLLSALTGLLYPLAVTGAAQALFPAQAEGSLVLRGGKPVGAAALLRRNLAIYGLGGLVVPFIGIKLIDWLLVAVGLV